MKLTKKKVFVVALVISLIAIISIGSLAWFSATDSVTNDFMFDDSDHDGTPDFIIDLFETENGVEVQGKDYENNAIPGAVLDKDPTVRNDGDYSMYARVLVTISDAEEWFQIAQKYYYDENTPASDWFWQGILEEKLIVDLSDKWVRYGPVVSENDSLTYVYYYEDILAPGETSESLFTKIQIPGELTQDDMDFGTADDVHFTITIKAEALQSDNMDISGQTGSENDAYKAFAYVGWEAGSDYPAS